MLILQTVFFEPKLLEVVECQVGEVFAETLAHANIQEVSFQAKTSFYDLSGSSDLAREILDCFFDEILIRRGLVSLNFTFDLRLVHVAKQHDLPHCIV